MASCKVVIHPVVLFSIVDSYERRNEDAKRVIGTLLGTIDKNVVEIKNCFCVPHNESKDEVAVDMEYAKNMYELHRKANINTQIVGWYATGVDVTEHSVLIHDFYSRETSNPVHLILDTTLQKNSLGIKAYVSSAIGVSDKTTVGTLFCPVEYTISNSGPEKVGVDWLKRTRNSSTKNITLLSDLKNILQSTDKISTMLDLLIKYVDNVLEGEIPANSRVGRMLMDLVDSVPQIKPQEFEAMLNSNMQDLLMICYLASVTKSQLAFGQKINSVTTT